MSKHQILNLTDIAGDDVCIFTRHIAMIERCDNYIEGTNDYNTRFYLAGEFEVVKIKETYSAIMEALTT